MPNVIDDVGYAMKRRDLPEFLRRLNEAWADEQRRRGEYVEWLDEDKRAEWISGEIVVHSPERWEHGEAIDLLNDLLRAYIRPRRLGVTGTNKLVRFTRNDYIPDLCFWPREVAEGFTPDQAIFPPPALVVEVVSESTEGNDRGVKFRDYAAGGVREYWIIDPGVRSLEQYVVGEEGYGLRAKLNVSDGGRLTSVVIDGFSVPLAALFDEAENLAALARLRNG